MPDIRVPDRFIDEHRALEAVLPDLLQTTRSGLDQGLPIDDVAEYLVRNGASPGYAGWLVRQLSVATGIPTFLVPVIPQPTPPPGPLAPPPATPVQPITMLEARARRRFQMGELGWRMHEAFITAAQFTLLCGFCVAMVVASFAASSKMAAWVVAVTFAMYFLGALVISGLIYGIAITVGLLASVSESTLHTSIHTSPYLDDDAKQRLLQP